jgi:hypothetical protein
MSNTVAAADVCEESESRKKPMGAFLTLITPVNSQIRRHTGTYLSVPLWFKVSFHLARVQGKKIDGSC